MSIFIPLWVLWIPLVWVVIGLLLYVPLSLWAGTKISPRRTGLNAVWSPYTGFFKNVFYIILAAICWPWVLWDVSNS